MDYSARRRKRVLRPLVEIPAWKAIDIIEGMKPRQLKALLLAMESCSQTNCWYGEYGFAQALLPFVRGLTPNAALRGGEAVPLESTVMQQEVEK